MLDWMLELVRAVAVALVVRIAERAWPNISCVVASDGPFGWGRRDDVVAVDGRISEKGFVRERKRVSKMFGNNGSWKVYILFRFGGWLGDAVAGLRATLGGGSVGGLVQKKVSRVRIAVVPDVPISWKALAGTGFLISWIRSLTSNEAWSAEEVAGIVNGDGRNWTVFPKRVPLVAGT